MQTKYRPQGGDGTRKGKQKFTEFAKSFVDNACKIGEREKLATKFYYRMDSLSRRA